MLPTNLASLVLIRVVPMLDERPTSTVIAPLVATDTLVETKALPPPPKLVPSIASLIAEAILSLPFFQFVSTLPTPAEPAIGVDQPPPPSVC